MTAWLRLLALLTVLACGALLAATAAARARGAALAHELGQQLLTMHAGATETAPVRLRVNGLSLSLRSGVSDLPASEVLETLRERCASAAGLRDLLPAGVRSRLPRSVADGVAFERGERQGYVACLDPGERLDRAKLMARLERFTTSGDLAELGNMRFAWVRQQEGHTHYVALDSLGALPLGQAFPAAGDAPGQDPIGVPRPPGARRLLSAGLATTDDAELFVYASRHTPERARADYARRLQGAGFVIESPAASEGELVVRGARLFALSVTPHGSGAVLSLLPLR